MSDCESAGPDEADDSPRSDTPSFIIYWSEATVLIRTPMGEIELSREDAERLVRRLVGGPMVRHLPRVNLSDEDIQLLRHLYVVEKRKPAEIAPRFGVSRATIYSLINRYNLRPQRTADSENRHAAKNEGPGS